MRKASRCFLLAMMVMVSAAGTAFAGEDEDEDTFEQKVIKKIGTTRSGRRFLRRNWRTGESRAPVA